MSTSGPAAGGSSNGDTPLLELKGLSKSFGPVRALTSVDLTILPGKVTALVGDNGAGKSVTIKTISGLWSPDGGQIHWGSLRSTRTWRCATTST
jgi:ABC-type sugar transport system ATPase subunit